VARSISDDSLKSLIYNLADLFILPSDIDNFPNTILESFACGVPVIASKVGGIPETVIEGHTGLLFDIHDASTLSSAIEQFYTNRELHKTMSSNCRSTVVEKYTLMQQAGKYTNLYHGLVYK
tara:strand:+ start:14168 stop:14533 length:366 start_codon:yes stop_codon:yes gene_type:complete